MATETDEKIGAGPYAGLSREQLVALLEKRDRQKKLGLVWERDEIEADRAVDADFVAAELLTELSDPTAGGSGWPNLVIEGDNFDALRWLRMTLSGRVKCIYVDPPYNTGARDWVYNDNYMKKEDRWRHSTWLEFLHRRFTLARDLLTEDGVMLVSINDENRAKLELLLDEVMPGMRVGSFVWRTRAGTAGEAPFYSGNHEHVLVYSAPAFSFGGEATDRSKYKNPDNDPRGPWTSVALQTNKDRFERPNSYFRVEHPESGYLHPGNPNRTWSFQLRAMGTSRGLSYEDLLDRGLIIFSNEEDFDRYDSLETLHLAIECGDAHPYLTHDTPDLESWVGVPIGRGSVRKKQFLSELRSETKAVSSWIERRGEEKVSGERVSISTTGTSGGTSAVIGIFGHKAFNYPKPPSLIRGLLEQSTSPGDLVLDFFAGSATTAQAVMQLNAEDGGGRRFVMVSSTEATTDEPAKNLCRDVTAERVRRLNAYTDGPYAALNAPFAYLRTRPVRFEDIDYDLAPAEAWTALETLHGLPVTAWDDSQVWAMHESEDVVLVFADRIEPALMDAVRALAARRAPAFVYAWTPGALRDALGSVDLEVRAVRETLVSRSRA